MSQRGTARTFVGSKGAGDFQSPRSKKRSHITSSRLRRIKENFSSLPACLKLIATLMQDPKEGVPRSSKNSLMHKKKVGFKGSDAVSWMRTNLCILSYETSECIAQCLLNEGFIYGTSGKFDPSSFYSFQEDTLVYKMHTPDWKSYKNHAVTLVISSFNVDGNTVIEEGSNKESTIDFEEERDGKETPKKDKKEVSSRDKSKSHKKLRKKAFTFGSNLPRPSKNSKILSPRDEIEPSKKKPYTTLEFTDEEIDEDAEDIIYYDPTSNRDGVINKVPLIKAASVDQLIQRLTSARFSDLQFRDAFLLTYRSFMTPSQLLAKLRERFLMQPPGSDSDPKIIDLYASLLSTVRLKVVTILRKWITDFEHDFIDTELRQDLVNFIERTIIFHSKQAGEHLINAISDIVKRLEDRDASIKGNTVIGDSDSTTAIRDNTKLTEIHHKSKPTFKDSPSNKQVSSSSTSNSSSGSSGEKFSFENCTVEQFALQMCLLESEYFRSIAPTELLNKNWSSEAKEEKAPHIMKMVKSFNKVSWWVTTQIVSEVKFTSRVNLVKKFIMLAGRLHDLCNYNGVFEITSGLNSAPVKRLKKTWEQVEQHKVCSQVWQELMKLTSHENSYKTYRTAVRNITEARVPYLGVYLTDLTFIEDGNPDNMNNMGNSLINWKKRGMIAEVIAEIRLFQQNSYEVTTNPSLLHNIKSLSSVSEEEAYIMSLKIEPRDTSEAIESLLMEEAKLRTMVQKLQLHIADLEAENQRLQATNDILSASLREERKELRQSRYFSLRDSSSSSSPSSSSPGDRGGEEGRGRGKSSSQRHNHDPLMNMINSAAQVHSSPPLSKLDLVNLPPPPPPDPSNDNTKTDNGNSDGNGNGGISTSTSTSSSGEKSVRSPHTSPKPSPSTMELPTKDKLNSMFNRGRGGSGRRGGSARYKSLRGTSRGGGRASPPSSASPRAVGEVSSSIGRNVAPPPRPPRSKATRSQTNAHERSLSPRRTIVRPPRPTRPFQQGGS